ncbi:amyloid-beta precursor protein-like isoform X1 [Styela clava]
MEETVGIAMLLFVAVALAVSDGSSPYQPSLAMFCGRVTQHRDIETGVWITDESGNTDCIKDKEEILNYCKKVYPTLQITNIVEGSEKTHIPSWCHVGSPPPCRGHGHNVKPIMCIEGEYKPKALEVGEGCTFEHTHDYETCHQPQYWEEKAAQICQSQGKSVDKTQMLKTVPKTKIPKSCTEVDEWQGVQFLCCGTPTLPTPKTNKAKAKVLPKPANMETVDRKSDINEICLQPKRIGLCRALLPAWFFNSDTNECEYFHYGGCGGNDNNFESREECVSKCQPDKAKKTDFDRSICGLKPDGGSCLAYFDRFYYDVTDGLCKKFVFGGCGGNANNFFMQDDCVTKCKGYTNKETGRIQIEPPFGFPNFEAGPVLLDEGMKTEATTTVEPTTTIDPVFYTDETTINDEHNVFIKKLENLKNEHQDKVTKILAKWDEDNAHLSDEDKERLRKLEDDLQRTITALEDEYDGKMDSLNEYHKDRMNQMINNERTKTLKKFLNLLKADEPKYRHILNALDKYIEVEKQDKSHVMQHYYMAINEEFDEASVLDFKNQLNEIDNRVNKTRTLLKNYPDIFSRIQEEVEEILASIPATPLDDNENEDLDMDDMIEEEVVDGDEDIVMTTPKVSSIVIDGGGIPDPDICTLPAVVGHCRASLPMFYYDSNEEKCKVFYYGGCGGNDNNFHTLEECQASCPGNANVFDYIDTNGVIDPKNNVEDEIIEEEVNEESIPLTDGLDNFDDNSIKSSIEEFDEELENEDETILDTEVDKLFKYNGDPKDDFDVDQPMSLYYENVNTAEISSHWVLWAGMGAGILFIAIVIVVIVVRRKTMRPAMRIVIDKPEEDDKELSPEEKQLLALQQNGYENPTYKFFEKQMA